MNEFGGETGRIEAEEADVESSKGGTGVGKEEQRRKEWQEHKQETSVPQNLDDEITQAETKA